MATTLAKGTTLKIDSGSGTFTAIAGVTSITWSGTSFSTEDTTSNDSTAPVKTMATTVYTNGDISIVVDWDHTNSQHAELRTLSTSGAAQNFKYIQADTSETASFSGFVTSFSYDTSTLGLIKAKAKISVNGAMSLS